MTTKGKKVNVSPDDGCLHITVQSGDAWLWMSNAVAFVRGCDEMNDIAFGCDVHNGSHLHVDRLSLARTIECPFVLRSDPWFRRLWPNDYDRAVAFKKAVHEFMEDARRVLTARPWR